MKDEFVRYLKDINMTNVHIERVREVFKFYEQVCTDEITDIFVTEYITDDGSRVYECLWFFSSKLIMEAKNFISNDNFDMMYIENRVVWWELTKEDYNLEATTTKSRMGLTVRMAGDIRCEMKASRENCEFLFEILKKYFIPNLLKSITT
jgi:hypothetical protein